MNRADLAWALNAVLPHVGTRVQGLDHVGMTCSPEDRVLYVYATDKYTLGIARVNDAPSLIGSIALPVKEATDLMRFVRPNRVGERDAYVSMDQGGEHGEELHVGFDDFAGDVFDSEVYETCEPKLTLGYMLDRVRRLNDEAPIEDDLIVQPRLVEKFAKAGRNDSDRLWILPRTVDERHGGAVVACGQNFVGAVSGLTYDELGEATLASFLHRESEAA